MNVFNQFLVKKRLLTAVMGIGIFSYSYSAQESSGKPQEGLFIATKNCFKRFYKKHPLVVKGLFAAGALGGCYALKNLFIVAPVSLGVASSNSVNMQLPPEKNANGGDPFPLDLGSKSNGQLSVFSAWMHDCYKTAGGWVGDFELPVVAIPESFIESLPSEQVIAGAIVGAVLGSYGLKKGVTYLRRLPKPQKPLDPQVASSKAVAAGVPANSRFKWLKRIDGFGVGTVRPGRYFIGWSALSGLGFVAPSIPGYKEHMSEIEKSFADAKHTCIDLWKKAGGQLSKVDFLVDQSPIPICLGAAGLYLISKPIRAINRKRLGQYVLGYLGGEAIRLNWDAIATSPQVIQSHISSYRIDRDIRALNRDLKAAINKGASEKELAVIQDKIVVLQIKQAQSKREEGEKQSNSSAVR